MAEPHTKGSHVLNAVKMLRSNRERALELLPPALHKYLEQRILPSSWYPLEEHLVLLRVLAQLWPATAGDPWALMGRGTAQSDLNGLYKMYLKPDDPARTLVAMGTLWHSAHDTGEARAVIEAPGRATLYMREFGIRSRDYCRITTGYVAEVIRLAGGRDAGVEHTRCRGDGETECVWRVTWS